MVVSGGMGLPDILAEGFVVGQKVVVLLSEHMVNVFHAPPI